jgi:hypothetical protein
MVDINLIPDALRKNGKGNANALTINIPKEILLGVAVGVILLMGTLHLLLGVVWLSGMGRLSSYKANWQKVLPDQILLGSMNEESGDLKKKINVIADMTTRKFVRWSSKFNAISDALPRGLWIRKMTLDKIGLVMEGSGVSKTQSEINNVGMFLSALKKNDDFMKDFSSLEVNSIQRSKINTIEVTDFTVMAKLK